MTLHEWVSTSKVGTLEARRAFETVMLEVEFRQQKINVDFGCTNADPPMEMWDMGFEFWVKLGGLDYERRRKAV